ncbi:LysR family transcriptional regulator [Roseateles sp. LKC17W]|uniref:LysR family transcriptional regulator n=2 Tax=Pelomonas margarita TaxID=3299031 RepID=A0ABW7FIP9_9BURK
MPTPMRELRALATLLKAAELGSLTNAAADQGITPQAASKTLAQLERQLGVKLLERTTRRLALTPEGQVLVDASRPALEAMNAALDAVRKAPSKPLTGHLSIAAPRMVVSTVLAPVVDAFSALHPKLNLHVRSVDQATPAIQGEDEVCFSFGPMLEQDVSSTFLMEALLLYCASPGYLAKHGVPRSVEALDARQAGMPVLEARTGGKDRGPMLSTNDDQLELQIARSGRLAMQLISLTAMPCIEDGTLVPLPSLGVDSAHLFICHYSSEVLPQVGAFVEFALDRLQGSQAFAPSETRLAALERAATRRRPSPKSFRRLEATSVAP